MIIAVTGHRPNKLGGEYSHTGPISDEIVEQMVAVIQKYKPEHVISGMALGADTLWVAAALITHTPFIAAVPFEGQERMWPAKSQANYHNLLRQAKEIVYVCDPGYAAWKMQKRNEWMIDYCDLLLAVWDGTPGGTSNCITYANAVGRKMLGIIPPRPH